MHAKCVVLKINLFLERKTWVGRPRRGAQGGEKHVCTTNLHRASWIVGCVWPIGLGFAPRNTFSLLLASKKHACRAHTFTTQREGNLGK